MQSSQLFVFLRMNGFLIPKKSNDPVLEAPISSAKEFSTRRFLNWPGRNSSRTMHAFIHKKGKTLPVPITSVKTRVKIPRKRKITGQPWPVLLLSNWIKCCCETARYGGFFFLGGKRLENRLCLPHFGNGMPTSMEIPQLAQNKHFQFIYVVMKDVDKLRNHYLW